MYLTDEMVACYEDKRMPNYAYLWNVMNDALYANKTGKKDRYIFSWVKDPNIIYQEKMKPEPMLPSSTSQPSSNDQQRAGDKKGSSDKKGSDDKKGSSDKKRSDDKKGSDDKKSSKGKSKSTYTTVVIRKGKK